MLWINLAEPYINWGGVWRSSVLLGGAACLAESYVDGKYVVFGGAHWCLKISPPVFHLESIVFFIKV